MSHPQAGQRIGELVARLSPLLADLRHLEAFGRPSRQELMSAPTLEDYRPAVLLQPALHGQCVDHPILGGPRVTTSPLVVIDRDWVRTWSRYYRLSDSGGAAR